MSQCYNKENIIFDYFAEDVYLHAFYSTALDGDVLLTLNAVIYFPTERATVTL
jgi:hypothetical protein